MGDEGIGTVARSGAAFLRRLGVILCLALLVSGFLHLTDAHAEAHVLGDGVPVVSVDAPSASAADHAAGETCHGIAGCSVCAPLPQGLTPLSGARTVARAVAAVRHGTDVPPPDRPPKPSVQA